MKKDIFEMSREERASRSYQREVFYKLADLRKAIHAAKQRKIALGDIADLDTEHFLIQLKKLGDINWGSDWEKTFIERPDVEVLDTEGVTL